MTAAGVVLAVLTITVICCLGVSAVRPAFRSWRTRRWLAEMDARAAAARAAAKADDGDDRGTADDDDDSDPPLAAARDPHDDDYYLHYRRPPAEYPAELLRPRAPEPVPGTPEAGLASWSLAMRLIHCGEIDAARKWLDVDDVRIDDTGNLVVELHGLTSSEPLYPIPGMRVRRDDFATPAELHQRIVELVRQVRAQQAAPAAAVQDDERLQRLLQQLAGDDSAINLVAQLVDRLAGPGTAQQAAAT